MSVELTLLFWSTALLGGYLGLQSTLYRVQHGIAHSAGPRDEEPAPNVWTARSGRALRNLLETYPAFVVLCVVVELGGYSDGLTQWGAHIYFWSRWVYLPLYVFGVPWLRSLVWTVAAGGLGLMFLGVLL